MRRFLFNAVMVLGSVASFFIWAGIKPKDLWGWSVSSTFPRWIWLVAGITLFSVGMGSSVYALIQSRRAMRQVSAAHSQPLTESKLRIHRALYGLGGSADIVVTDVLQKSARDGLVVEVDNRLVPRDPAPNIRKRLYVEYSYGSDAVIGVNRPESDQTYVSRLVLPEDSEIVRLQRELSAWQARYDKEKTQDLNELALAKNKVIELERSFENAKAHASLPLEQSQVLAKIPVVLDDIRVGLLCFHRGTSLDFTQTTLFFNLSIVSDTDTGIKSFAVHCTVGGRTFTGIPMDDLSMWVIRTPFKNKNYPFKTFQEEVLDTRSLWRDVQENGLKSGLVKTGWIGLHIPEAVPIQNTLTKVRFDVTKPLRTSAYKFWFSDKLVECEREKIFDIDFLKTS